MSERTDHFMRLLTPLRRIDRAVLVLRLATVRISRRWPLIFYVGTIAAFFAGLYCGVARIVPASFGKTIINRDESGYLFGAGEGLFQGMAGGLMWGGVTAAFLAFGWILFRSPGAQWARNRVRINLTFGLLGGIVGGIGVTAEVWFMFTAKSLHDLKWIPQEENHTLSACIHTGYCLFYPSLGPSFGIGLGLAAAWLYISNRWQDTMASHVKAGRIINLGRATFEAFKLTAYYSVVTAVLLFSSAVAFSHFVGNDTLPYALGETFAVWIGNIGAVFGIAIALLIMRVGINIAPYTD